MASINLYTPDRGARRPAEMQRISEFLQRMVNRMAAGFHRYGPAQKEQKYMTRINLCWKKYKRTGNCEFLYDLANYALLESLAPENKKFHFNPEQGSASRAVLGGAKD
jgi:hypothetical protein